VNGLFGIAAIPALRGLNFRKVCGEFQAGCLISTVLVSGQSEYTPQDC
jgi:hypothetical protein